MEVCLITTVFVTIFTLIASHYSDKVVEQSETYNPLLKKAQQTKAPASTFKRLEVVHQGADSSVMSIVAKQTVPITVRSGVVQQNAMCILLNDHALVANKHLLKPPCNVGMTFTITVGDQKIELIETTIGTFDHDVIVVCWQKPIAGVSNILRHFVSKNISPDALRKLCFMTVRSGQLMLENVRNVQPFIHDESSLYFSGYMETSTSYGDCGQPYLAVGDVTSLSSKVCGIHSGISKADHHIKIIAYLNREDLEGAIQELTAEYKRDKVGEVIAQADLVIVDRISPAYPIPQKNKIRPTRWMDKFTPHQKAPSALSKVNGVSPLFKAIGDWKKLPAESMTQDRKDFLLAALMHNVKRPQNLPLTLLEAINGCDLCEKLDRDTSMGHPYRGLAKDYFDMVPDAVQDYYVPKPAVLEDMINIAKSWSEGTRVDNFYPVVSLKGELRKIARVENAETRAFCVSSKSTMLIEKMLLTPFLREYVVFPTLAESSVGINVHGPDAKRLADRFAKQLAHMLALDYKRYDKSLHEEQGYIIAHAIATMAREAFGERIDLDFCGHLVNVNVYNVFYQMFVHVCTSPIIILSYLCAVIYHLPSGALMTQFLNFLHNLSLFIDFTKVQLGDVSPSDILKIWNLSFHGDDVFSQLLAIEFENKLNQIEYQKYCLRMGMTVTPADKTGVMTKFVHRDDATYLKRKLVKVEGTWRMPREETEIWETLYWYEPNSTSTEKDYLIEASEAVALEFHHYGRAKYDEVCDLLRTMLYRDFGVVKTFKSYTTVFVDCGLSAY